MPNTRRKRILVALDGSERSLHTVRYVSRVPGFRNMTVVLFSVYSEIPEGFWDLQKMPQFSRRIGEIHAWETQSRQALEETQEEARRILVKAGLPEEAVVVMNRKMRQGVARDILKEGKTCNAIAAGRRSSGKIKELMLGSVSTKLIEKVDFAPLVLVGKESTPDRILVALDGSPNSMRAVGCVARMMAGSEARVLLFHAIRGTDEKLIRLAGEAMEEVFEQARGRLAKAGLSGNLVDTRIVSGVESRAGAIVGEARVGDYKTVVIGRKGYSRIRQFFMGRVSKKVVYLGRGLAVWIVN